MAISVSDTLHSSPPRIVIHGAEKVGKSTFCSQAPNPRFLPTESGLGGLATKKITEDGKQRLETYAEFDAALTWAEHNLGSYETLVIDSADWLELLIHGNIMGAEGKNNMGECCKGFGKAYGVALEYWRHITMRLDRINQAGKWIILSCHSKSIPFNDPNFEPYDLWSLKLHSPKNGNGAREYIQEWADMLLFAQIETFVSQTKESTADNNEARHRATSTGKRILELDNNRAFVAGNRYGLTGSCELTFPALMRKFSN
jgi:hypothetical protein